MDDCPEYRKWKASRRIFDAVSFPNRLLSIPFATRNVRIAFVGEKEADTSLGSNEMLFKKRRVDHVGDGEARIARFIKLLDLLSTAPWAPLSFSVNESMIKRLIASHIPLIVGNNDHRATLLPLIGNDLENAQNTVWVTNRQQGKTTTLSK